MNKALFDGKENNMITPKFWLWLKAALIRAARTIAQTMVALIPAGVAIQDVSWGIVLSTAFLAGILSLLTSIATGLPEADQQEQLDNIRTAKELNGQDDNIG